MVEGKSYREPARDVPVLGEWDVVVCGGGPAGCAAAIAAARAGARTLLIEKDGQLGGAVVSQLVCVVLSTNGADFQGIWHEYASELKRRGGICGLSGRPPQLRGAVDPEQVKYAWDALVDAAGVRLLHHAHAAGAVVEDGAVRGVLVETRAGRRAVFARRVIDATGDGAVAAAAGARWDCGDGIHPWAMALTKVFRMGGVRRPADWPDEAAMEKLRADLEAALRRGEFDSPVLAEKDRLLGYLRGWHWALPPHRSEMLSVLSRVLKVDPLDPWDFTRAEREGRQQARQAAEFLCRYAPGFENAYLLDTSNQIGLRSSRRIRGLAVASADDALHFRKYDDGVARSSWDIDVWPADSYSRPAVPRDQPEYRLRRERLVAGEYFDVRYGCLVPAGVDGLLVAGRCVSAEHQAQASLRIQQTCMATGQAAGLAAAMSLAAGVPPRQLDPAALVARLERDRAAVEPAFECLRGLPLAPR